MVRIAICICTCDRPDMLRRTLARVRCAERSGLEGIELGVVVVDNRPDGTARTICDELRPELGMALHFVEEPVRGISFARNRAVAEAMARDAGFVAFIDDDDEPQPEWLARLVQRQRATGADLVFGGWQLPEQLDLPPRIADVRYFRSMRIDAVNRYGLPAWAGTYNVLLSRRLLETLTAQGPVFRVEFARSGGGDMDLFIRADRLGFRHAGAPESVVTRCWEAGRLTLQGVLQRAFLRGGSTWHLAHAHLPAARARKLKHRALRSLVGATLRLPWGLVRPAYGTETCQKLARAAGLLHAASGRRFHYYAPADAPAHSSGPR